MRDFFSGLSLASHDPVLAIPLDNRPPGEAYVRFKHSDDTERAMRRHKALMGRRFIEVFKVVDAAELEEARTKGWTTLEDAADRLNIDTTWEDSWKEEDGYVVRIRGLPWESTVADIREFFTAIPLADADIDVVTTAEGKQTGEAFIRLKDREQMVKALERNKKLIGRRYIEVFKSTLKEFENPAERKEMERRAPPLSGASRVTDLRDVRGGGFGVGGPVGGARPPPGARQPPPASVIPSRLPRAEQAARDGFMSFYGRSGRVEGGRKGPAGAGFVVRIRGLSFGTTEREVYDFFSPIPLAALHIIVDNVGRPSGDAYAEMETQEDETRALDRHRQSMGRRYIEVFRCSPSELSLRLSGSAGGSAAAAMGGGGGGYRGAPAPRGPPPPRGGPMGGYPPAAAPFAPPHPGASFPPTLAGSPDDPSQSTCLKARGIPWEATEEDVLKFFQQSGFSPISLHRQQGEAFVEFARPEHASAAMQLHRGLIGTRYIELLRCSYNEMARVVGLPLKEAAVPPADGYGGGGAGGFGGYGGGGYGAMAAGGYAAGGYGGGYDMMQPSGYDQVGFAGQQGYPPQGGFSQPGYMR